MKKFTPLFVLALTVHGVSYSQGLNNLLSPLGRVGIGTLNPQSRFHVIGNTKIDSTLTARSL